MKEKPVLIFKDKNSVQIGVFERYTINVKTPIEPDDESKLELKVKNLELQTMMLLYLLGPYSLYIQLLPYNYSEDNLQAEEIQVCPNLHPGNRFKIFLKFNKNSLKSFENGIFEYEWKLDIVSQIVVSNIISINFEVTIDDIDKIGEKTELFVNVEDSKDIWNKNPKHPDKPCHLIIATHGIYSNIDCDLLYLKEKLEEFSKGKENIIIRGYRNNVGHSEKGIKWLGINLANYIDYLLNNGEFNITKISFIGHSLGGIVQSFAIYYLLNYQGYKNGRINYLNSENYNLTNEISRKLLKDIKPINFITMASPLLGTSSEFTSLINIGLEIGSLGKTGKDLSLKNRYLSRFSLNENHETKLILKPILEILSIDLRFHYYLKGFNQRISFANILNDGIVPLKTSALLYLDYHSLTIVKKITENNKNNNGSSWSSNFNKRLSSLTFNSDKIGEIPETYEEEDKPYHTHLTRKQKRLQRYQVINEENDETDKSIKETLKDELYVPPQSSSILSVIQVVKSPTPPTEFFLNFKPINSIDNSTIVHDKTYYYEELPPPHYNKLSKLMKYHFSNKDLPFFYKSRKSSILTTTKNFRNHQLSEKISRCYLFDKSWRKVLVNLKPDAHNNITVRRQFINAYGWNVINYLGSIFDFEDSKNDEEFEKAKVKIDQLDKINYDSTVNFHVINDMNYWKKIHDILSEPDDIEETENIGDTEINDNIKTENYSDEELEESSTAVEEDYEEEIKDSFQLSPVLKQNLLNLNSK